VTGGHTVTEAHSSCCYTTWPTPQFWPQFHTQCCSTVCNTSLLMATQTVAYFCITLYRGRRARAVAELRAVHRTSILSPQVWTRNLEYPDENCAIMYCKYVSTDSGTYCSVYVSLQHVNCALAQVQVHSAIFTVFSVLHKFATTIRSMQPHDTKRGHYRRKKK